MRFSSIFALGVGIFLFTGCAAKKIKDISYIPNKALPKLNVFVPRKTPDTQLPVLIFVHGGNWNSGSKDQYGFFGRNFAKKGIITVIPDYTLSPNANYDEMAQEIAKAIAWVQKHISDYGGNPNRMYLTGHSAGGQLVALAVMNPKYGIDPNDISGIILNDSGGLDMYHFLKKNPPETENNYRTTWTTDPKNWKDASPIYFINQRTPPIMVYMGAKSYPFIKSGNRKFIEALHPFQLNVEPIVLNKKHISMIIQYFWPWSKRYSEIKRFIKTHP